LLNIINRVSTFIPDRDITEHGNTFPADFPSDWVRDELVEKFEKRLFHLRNYGYWMTLFAVSFLFTSLFEGEHGPLNDVFSPAQLQTLTSEQVEILRKKTEQFLQQNQEIEWPVTE
jgi:hypothetical protein